MKDRSDPTKKRIRAETGWPSSKGGYTDGQMYVSPWFPDSPKGFGMMNRWLTKHPGFHGGHKIMIGRGSAVRASRPNGSSNIWRKRQIALPPEIVSELYAWHGGQFTPTYALASTAHSDFVSLSMIDGAIVDLDSTKGKKPKDLRDLIGDLYVVREYWKEHAEKLTDSETKYDRADYGLTEADEAEIDVESG